MRFVWDEAKRLSNIRKHGLDFAWAIEAFGGPSLTFVDDRLDYGEARCVTIGLVDARVVVIVHTEIAEEVRIISARKGLKHEQALFWEHLGPGLVGF